MHLPRILVVAALAALTACSADRASFAPAGTQGAQNAPTLPGAAVAARPGSGYTVLDFHYHIMPLRTSPQRAAVSPDGLIYPLDLRNFGGPIMKSMVAHNIYVNCPPKNQSCWGAPEGFQTKLAGSQFAALLTQYTGAKPSAYTFGEGTAVTYTVHPGTALYENDLFQIVHSVAATLKKTGYTNMYHIFLPKGTDTCFDFTTQCYAPNMPGGGFCAYHGIVRFSDIGNVIYSVEPYQNINGCRTPKSKGATQLTNSTISTLAHETFEAITDPGAKLAWYNFQGGEIGDECEFSLTSVTLSGTVYNTQPMYSNKYHACATGP